MALPDLIFVVRMKDRDGSTWLNVTENQVEAVEQAESDEVSVGTYRLVKTNKLSIVKTLRFANKKKR